MNFQPYPTRSSWLALVAALLAGVAAIVLIDRLLRQNDPAQIFIYLAGILITLIVTGLALYWLLIALKLDYKLNRNGLTIQWGFGRLNIPISTIETIIPGEQMATLTTFKGLNPGGLHLGWGQSTTYGRLKFRATAPLERSLLIVTTDRAYVISPQKRDSFIDAWQAHQAIGPTQQWPHQIESQGPLTIPVLADTVTWWLLGSGGLLCLALFGYLTLHYADLPQSLPVHFNHLGRADRIADKITLFILPVSGLIVWGANAILGMFIHRRERVGAYMLWSIAIAMQLCLGVALFTLTAG